MKKKLYKDIKMKSGITLLKDSMVEVNPVKGNNHICHIVADGNGYNVNYLAVFREPSMECFEKWSWDDLCETPSGTEVEMDGHDPEGYPSWLLVAGLI